MPVITVGTENSGAIGLYYEDHGSGRPVILIHGYPLSGRAWDKQVPALLAAGYRVITYDRRGFGASSRPAGGYDWDTLAADLAALVDALGLERVSLVGHSMGTGEIVRYLSQHGSARVDRAVLISPLPPFLRQGPDNPDGLSPALFEAFRRAAEADIPAWMTGYLDDFYNMAELGGSRVSDELCHFSWNLAVAASLIAAIACIAAGQADFRADLPLVDVPVLVIAGDADRVLPYDKSGRRLPGLIADLELVVIKGGPHGITWTHAGQVSEALLRFLTHPAAAARLRRGPRWPQLS